MAARLAFQYIQVTCRQSVPRSSSGMTSGPLGAPRPPKSTWMTVMSHARLAARRWRAEFGLPGRSAPFPCSFPFQLAFPLHSIASAGSTLEAQYWSSASCVGVTVVTPHCRLIKCDLRRVADRGLGRPADRCGRTPSWPPVPLSDMLRRGLSTAASPLERDSAGAPRSVPSRR